MDIKDTLITIYIVKKPINIGGMNTWDSLNKNLVLVGFCMLLFCCTKTPGFRIETWDYHNGLKNELVTDTIFGQAKFNNPYLIDILFLDSLLEILDLGTGDTTIKVKEGILYKTKNITLWTERGALNLFRANFFNSQKDQDMSFVYEQSLGVIAYYIYGHGYMKLIHRNDIAKTINLDSSFYERVFGSETLFPSTMPDSLELYDMFSPRPGEM